MEGGQEAFLGGLVGMLTQRGGRARMRLLGHFQGLIPGLRGPNLGRMGLPQTWF